MQILNKRYTLIPTMTATIVKDNTDNKIVFSIPDNIDFNVFKKGDDLYVIGCEIVPVDKFEEANAILGRFRETTLIEFRNNKLAELNASDALALAIKPTEPTQ